MKSKLVTHSRRSRKLRAEQKQPLNNFQFELVLARAVFLGKKSIQLFLLFSTHKEGDFHQTKALLSGLINERIGDGRTGHMIVKRNKNEGKCQELEEECFEIEIEKSLCRNTNALH